jgi:hypothetical protein
VHKGERVEPKMALQMERRFLGLLRRSALEVIDEALALPGVSSTVISMRACTVRLA